MNFDFFVCNFFSLSLQASFPSTQCYTNAPPLNPYAPAQNPYAVNQSPYAHYMTPPMPPYAPMPAINPYYNIPLQASPYMNTPMYAPSPVYQNLSSIADPTQTEDEKKAIKKQKAFVVLLKGFILFVNLNLLVSFKFLKNSFLLVTKINYR